MDNNNGKFQDNMNVNNQYQQYGQGINNQYQQPVNGYGSNNQYQQYGYVNGDQYQRTDAVCGTNNQYQQADAVCGTNNQYQQANAVYGTNNQYQQADAVCGTNNQYQRADAVYDINNQYRQFSGNYVNNENNYYENNYNQGNQNGLNNQQMFYMNYQNQYNSPQMMNSVVQTDNYSGISNRRFISVGMIMGLISSILLLIGLLIPAIDFSHFHPEIDIQYNLIKICKNVRLISPIWTGLPIGIIIGIVLMVILSFVRIPQFRLIPCMIVISMFVVMLVDMQNIIVWADELLNSEAMQEICNQEFIINKAEVFKSFQSGIYLMIAGVVIGVISSFLKPSIKK